MAEAAVFPTNPRSFNETARALKIIGKILAGTSASGPGVALNNEQFIVFANSTNLNKERRLVMGNALDWNDGGLNSTLTLNVLYDDSTLTKNGSNQLIIKDSGVSTAKIADDAVTFAKIQNLTQGDFIGRGTAGTGDSEAMRFTGSGITAAFSPGLVTLTVGNSHITNARMADMAQSRVKGRASGAGTGAPQDLTPDQLMAILNEATTDLAVGLIPAHASTHASGGGDAVDHDTLTNFVANEHVDHSAVTLTAGDGLSGGGDLTANRSFAVNVDSSTIEINTDALRLKDGGTTNAKLANMAEATIKGRAAGAGLGVPTDLSASQVRTILDVPTNAEAILDALIDAKGDLIVGSAADTPARLAVGTNGYVLTADSAEATGVKWSAPVAGYTDEQAQDAVGGILSDSTEIDWNYTDEPAPSISGSLFNNSVVVAKLHASTSDVFFGRDTAGAGAGEEIGASAARTILGLGSAALLNSPIGISDGGTGQTTAVAAFDALAPTTTQGDLIYHNGTDNVRLGIGATGSTVRSNGAASNPKWIADTFNAATSGIQASFDYGGGTMAWSLNINGLTADASPDAAADYVTTYDADAGLHKKVLLSNLPGGSLASHNHTSAGGDGGVLTNDEHDGFLDIAESSTPSNPATNHGRLFCRANGSNIELVFISSQGTEYIICSLPDNVVNAELQLNWVE